MTWHPFISLVSTGNAKGTADTEHSHCNTGFGIDPTQDRLLLSVHSTANEVSSTQEGTLAWSI